MTQTKRPPRNSERFKCSLKGKPGTLHNQPAKGDANLGQDRDRYIAIHDQSSIHDRMIFACHSEKTKLFTDHRDDVILWDHRGLAKAAIKNGLIDWLAERVG